jgi:hypothetical protein
MLYRYNSTEFWEESGRLVWPVFQGNGNTHYKVVITGIHWTPQGYLIVSYKDHGIK